MARSKTSSFVLTLKLNTSARDSRILNDRFYDGFLMYNRLVKHARKRLSGMRQDKRYRSLMEEYHACKGDTPEAKKERARIGTCLSDLRAEYGLSEYQFHAWIAVQQHRYTNSIDSLTAQKTATSVWQAVEAVLFRKGKTIHFKRFDGCLSLEGKNNRSGIRFADGRLQWLGLSIMESHNLCIAFLTDSGVHKPAVFGF